MKLTWKNNNKNTKKRSLAAVSNFPNLPFENNQDQHGDDNSSGAQLNKKEKSEEGLTSLDASDSSDAKQLAQSFQALGNKLAEIDSFLLILFTTLEGRRKYREALGKWEAALTLMPESAVLHEQKAQVLLEIGDSWNALKAATRATEVEPSWAECISRPHNQWEDLFPCSGCSIPKTPPKPVTSLQMLEALDTLNRVILIKRCICSLRLPMNASVGNALTKKLMFEKDSYYESNASNVKFSLLILVSSSPIPFSLSSCEGWITLGRAQLNFGEPDSAIESFDKALVVKPDSEEAQVDRHTALHLIKRRKQLQSTGLSSSQNRYAVGDKTNSS
ncbi:Tetratricopeptide repeat protein 33 [Morella rubra]|uniref:Tetratricopeptide repeat protein 33 n=1 Tax=Morella rubra TaxID=262757 RepID=A0A6A1UTM7_9ROSI|nr:Tetratricopeptide repeat protein 33 [Morella rubra]